MTIASLAVVDDEKDSKSLLPADEKAKDIATVEGKVKTVTVPPVRYNEDSLTQSHCLKTRRQRLVFLAGLSCILTVLGTILFLSYMIHFGRRGFLSDRTFRGRCNAFLITGNRMIREDIEIGKQYETIKLMTPLAGFPQVEVAHMFDKRITVLRTPNRCYIKSMKTSYRLPTNTAYLKQQMQQGHLIPEGRMTRQHWYIERPAMPRDVVKMLYGRLMHHLCANRPTSHLLHRYEFMDIKRVRLNQIKSRLEKPCKQAEQCNEQFGKCPKDFYRHLDEVGCMPTCNCVPKPPFVNDRYVSKTMTGVMCPDLSINNCPAACDQFDKDEATGCRICKCKSGGSGRGKRTINDLPLMDPDANPNCVVRTRIFEGIPVGLENDVSQEVPQPTEAVINFIHDCI